MLEFQNGAVYCAGCSGIGEHDRMAPPAADRLIETSGTHSTPETLAAKILEDFGIDSKKTADLQRIDRGSPLSLKADGTWCALQDGAEVPLAKQLTADQYVIADQTIGAESPSYTLFNSIQGAARSFAHRVGTLESGEVHKPASPDEHEARLGSRQSKAGLSDTPFLYSSPERFVVALRADLSPEIVQITLAENLIGRKVRSLSDSVAEAFQI